MKLVDHHVILNKTMKQINMSAVEGMGFVTSGLKVREHGHITRHRMDRQLQCITLSVNHCCNIFNITTYILYLTAVPINTLL